MMSTHTVSELKALAVQYIEAVGQKKLDTLASLLHPELEFSGNVAASHGAESYVAAIRRLFPIIVRNDIKRYSLTGTKSAFSMTSSRPSARWRAWNG